MENKILWPGWETVRIIGRGSYGTVYEIERELYKGEKQKAALKVISIPHNESEVNDLRTGGYDDQSITRIFEVQSKEVIKEYALMNKLSGHTNIVNCQEFRHVQQKDGLGWDVFIRMELLKPFTSVLGGTIEEDQVIAVGKDLCRALTLCRKYNILHRDIKPQNIFVSDTGDYKLGDFGIARTMEQTGIATAIGTLNYMAPEVSKGDDYGHRADIYSLGLVLYWMLNERRMPFLPLPPQILTPLDNDSARRRRFNGDPIPEPKNGSAALKAIVLKACAYKPEDRYASAEDMLAALNNLSKEPAVGEDTIIKKESSENDTILKLWNFDELSGTLTINGKGPMEDYIADINTPWNKHKEKICRVIIKPGITSIGSYAFRNCGSLESIVIPGGVISIGKGAFCQCKGLKTVEIPDSIRLISDFAFDGCSSLKKICYKGRRTQWNTVTIGHNAIPEGVSLIIEKKQNLKSLLILAAALLVIVSAVLIVSSTNKTWSYDEATGTLSIWGEGNMSKRTPWDRYDSGIKSVVIEDGVTSIADHAFSRCIELVYVSIPDSVTSIGNYAFSECYGLNSIELPDGITSIGDYAFHHCDNLSNINIPDSARSIGEGAFHSCESLGSMILDNSSVAEIGPHAFYGCSGLSSISLPDSISSIEGRTLAFCTGLSSVVIPDGVISIEMEAFGNCSGLTGVFIPVSVTDIGNRAFEACDKLTNIYYAGTEAQWRAIGFGEDCFTSNPNIHYECSKGVYGASVETISAGCYHTVGLKSDGTAVAVGQNYYGRCDVSGWRDIVAISAGGRHTVGLKSNGTVVAVGDNSIGQGAVNGWLDIVAISAGLYHTVGLKLDGTVVATGQNDYGQCNVSGWRDVVAISASTFHTVGLKSDGTVVAVGDNSIGQGAVNGWRDIVTISAGELHTVGLKSDGTVVATEHFIEGFNNGQCDVSGWRDIVAISAGGRHTVGLKSDGTVVATGQNDYGQCDVSGWRNIVAISAGNYHTVGLKADGTVVTVGFDGDGRCDVGGWTDIRVPLPLIVCS